MPNAAAVCRNLFTALLSGSAGLVRSQDLGDGEIGGQRQRRIAIFRGKARPKQELVAAIPKRCDFLFRWIDARRSPSLVRLTNAS